MTGFEPATAAEKSGVIYTAAGFDPLALLPAAAADRLRALRQKKHDAHSLIPEFADRHEANTARGDAERRLKRLLAPRAENGFSLRENDPQVVHARRELAKLADEARRLSELDEVRTEAWRSASRVVQAIEQWLRDGRPRNTVLQDHEVEVPKLNKGETIVDGIERFRRRGRELKADLHRIQSAPYPSSYAKQQMRAQIEALAMRGAPNVSNLTERDREIAWPTQMLRSEVHNTPMPSVAFAETYDLLPLFAWLHRDALVKRLDQEIDSESDDAAALSHEVRQQQEAAVMADLLDIERQEAALTWKAQAERLPVEFRSDINPVALLGVRLMTAPRANPSPGTSPEHAFNIIGVGR